MHALVKVACAIHSLSLAAAYGGPLFAKTGLRAAVKKDIPDEKERFQVMDTAWNKFNNMVTVPAHIAFTATWLVERGAIKELSLDRRAKALVVVKDVLIAGALVTGLANVAAGRRLSRELRAVTAQGGDAKACQATVQKYKNYFKVMGPIHQTFLAGSIGIGPFLSAAIIGSSRRGILARLLHR